MEIWTIETSGYESERAALRSDIVEHREHADRGLCGRGYVAACSAGLRRRMDGILHGVVSWGMTMLFFALVTGSVTGNALAGLFNVASVTTAAMSADSGDSAMADLFSRIRRGDRSGAIAVLRDRFGINEAQAAQSVDRAPAMRTPSGSSPENGLRGAADAALIASTWLSAAILLSLLTGAAGGLLGARGARRRALPDNASHVHSRTPARTPAGQAAAPAGPSPAA